MADDEPTTRQITIEVLIYVSIVLIVGAIFVGLRVLREGPRVLSGDPRALRVGSR